MALLTENYYFLKLWKPRAQTKNLSDFFLDKLCSFDPAYIQLSIIDVTKRQHVYYLCYIQQVTTICVVFKYKTKT